MLTVDVDNGELPVWIEVLCDDRAGLVHFLKNQGISAREATPNLNLSQHMRDKHKFENSDFFDSRILILPSGPDQDPDQIERVFNALVEFESMPREQQ